VVTKNRMSGSDSGSSSSSYSSDSSAKRRRRQERKERKKAKKEKKERKRRDKEKKEKKHRKHEKKSKHVVRSIVTGKRVQRKDFASADGEGEARREAMRSAMNEGEDDEYGARAAPSASQAAAHEAAQKALSNPAAMLELMRASSQAQAAKRQRLSAMRASQDGGGDDYAGAISREYATQRSTGGGKRTAYDAADYMKRDSGF
jgi:hypothetical protein